MKASDNVFPKEFFDAGSAYGTPAAGTVVIYAKSDGLMYSKDDAGVETALGGGGGTWGSITGTLSAQTDLQAALDALATLDTIPEAAPFNADPATHAGLNRLILAGDDVTFDVSEGYSAGDVFNVIATAALSILTTGVTLTLPPGGSTSIPADAAFTVVMTGSAAGYVIGGGGGGGGTGDVVGPASAVDDRLASFDGTTGKLIQDSGKAVSDFATAAQGALAGTALQPAAIGTTVQGYDADLAAIAGVTSAADKVPYFTGSGTAATADFNALGRSVVGAASQAAARTALGAGTGNGDFSGPGSSVSGNFVSFNGTGGKTGQDSGKSASDFATAAQGALAATALQPGAIGTTVQGYDADLAAIAGLTSAADKGIQFTGSGTAGTYDLTAFAKTILDDANQAAVRTTLALVPGTDVQAYDATLNALAGANWAANAFPIGSGADTLSQVSFAANTFPARASTGNLVAKSITDNGLSFLAAADVVAMRAVTNAVGSGSNNGTASVVSNTTTKTAVYTISIPANSVIGTKSVRIKIGGAHVNNSGAGATLGMEVVFGSTTMWSSTTGSLTASANPHVLSAEFNICALNSSSSQFMHGHVGLSSPTVQTAGVGDLSAAVTAAAGSNTPVGGPSVAGSTENGTTALNFVFSVKHSVAASTITFTGLYYSIEFLN